MRLLMVLAFFPVLAMSVRADTFVYVSMAPEQKIQVYRLNPGDGQLAAVEAVATEGAPGALAFDPSKQFLYASLRSNSTLASFKVDPTTGKLKPINAVELPKGENAAYVATDRSGKYLISASYSAGKIVVHKLKADGSIESPAIQTVTTEKTAHCVVSDREGKFVFVPHVAPNAVFTYKLTGEGKLEEVGRAKAGIDKAGPRHLAFHPTLPLAFSSDEVANTITAYKFDPNKGLEAVQTLSTLPADYKEKNTTAEVKVHPSGKFVWVSNRGHDSLAGFAIDGKTGTLKSLGQTPTEKTPRSFEIDPSGKYLFGAGEGTGKLVVYKIDLETGKLTPQNTLEVGKSLTWVLAGNLGK